MKGLVWPGPKSKLKFVGLPVNTLISAGAKIKRSSARNDASEIVKGSFDLCSTSGLIVTSGLPLAGVGLS